MDVAVWRKLNARRFEKMHKLPDETHVKASMFADKRSGYFYASVFFVFE